MIESRLASSAARALTDGVIKVIVIVGAACLLSVMILSLPHFVGDFHDFYQAASFLRDGQSPYVWTRFYNPVWIALAFLPLAYLPEGMAYRVYTLFSVLALVWIAARLKQGNQRLALLSIACLVVSQILFGTFDWLLLAALVVPAPLAVLLLLSKPQLGIWLAAYLMLKMNWRMRIISGALISAGFLVSLLLGMHAPALSAVALWNVSVFPLGLLAGIPIVFLFWRRQDKAGLLGVSLLLSPYWQYTSWLVLYPTSTRSRSQALMFSAVYAVLLIQFIAQVTLMKEI